MRSSGFYHARPRRTPSYGGFGSMSDPAFTQYLTSDGLPTNIANRDYSVTFQDYYIRFRQYLPPAAAWNLMMTLDRDQGIQKTLDSGTSPALIYQGWQHGLFLTGSTTAAAIVAGQNPTTVLTEALKAKGFTPASGAMSPVPVSDYMKYLPAGVSPGWAYSITDANGKVTTYQPDWDTPPGVTFGTPAATTSTTSASVTQAQIPASDPYWSFPSGDVENSDGTVTGGQAIQNLASTLTAPINLDGFKVSPLVLALGAGVVILGGVAVMEHHPKGRRK